MGARRVVVIGDATLDLIVRPAAEPQPGGDAAAEITLAAGGQGANVAVHLARAGVETRLVCALGTDPAGRLLAEGLGARGLELAAAEAPRSSVVLSLVRGGERTMRSDRQTIPVPDPGLLADARWVHVSGYALADDENGDRLAELLGARVEGVRLSVGGASGAAPGEGLQRLLGRLRLCRPDLLVVGRPEAEWLVGSPIMEPTAAAAALTTMLRVALVVVTDGERGSAAAGAGLELPMRAGAPRLAGPILDPTGAGDAFAAALIAALQASRWPPSSATTERALAAASRLGGRVARTIGAQARTAEEPDGR